MAKRQRGPEQALETTLDTIHKRFGDGAIMKLGTAQNLSVQVIPTGSLAVDVALGVGGALVSVGIVVGPTLGGLILEALSWNWIFFVNLPIGILGILMVLRFVPNIQPEGGERFDVDDVRRILRVELVQAHVAAAVDDECGARGEQAAPERGEHVGREALATAAAVEQHAERARHRARVGVDGDLLPVGGGVGGGGPGHRLLGESLGKRDGGHAGA